MTHKDYITIAGTFAHALSETKKYLADKNASPAECAASLAVFDDTIAFLADTLSKGNKRFDKQLFIEMCTGAKPLDANPEGGNTSETR